MDQVLGFVGVGRMGGPMANRLLDAGHTLCVFDTSAEAVKPLAARGAKVASSAEEVASSADIVLISLPTPPIVQAVSLGQHPEGESTQDAHRSLDDGTDGCRHRGEGCIGARRGVGGLAGQWRHRRCDQGHAGGDGVVQEGHVPGCRSGAQDIRQDVLRWREAGPRADREAGEQPAGRRGDRAVVRSAGDGRESRTRRHRRCATSSMREADATARRRTSSRSRSSRARSISASQRACPTRTCACVSTRPRRSASRWWPARRCVRCSRSPTRSSDPIPTSPRSPALLKNGRGWKSSSRR